MVLNIKPIATRVVVEPVEAETKTASGIIIPDTAKEKSLKGKIVAVGNGTKDYKMTVKVGDEVIFGRLSGTDFNFQGTDYIIMKEEEIYAVL